MSIVFAGYFLVLYLFQGLFVEGYPGLVFIFGLWVFVAEPDEHDAICGSVDQQGFDQAGFLEVEKFCVVEKDFAGVFSDPVFAVLFFDEVLGLLAFLFQRHFGALELEVFLESEVGFFFFQVVEFGKFPDSPLKKTFMVFQELSDFFLFFLLSCKFCGPLYSQLALNVLLFLPQHLYLLL